MKKIIKILIAILIIVILITLWARFIGTKGLKTNEYKIVNTKITNSYHGLKIVHLSDIHYGSTIKDKQMENLVNKVNELNPDIIVFTGDLLDEEYETNNIVEYLTNLQAKIGKYAVNGNHDDERFNEIVNKSGFINLNDSYKLIYYESIQPIIISGISSNLEKNDLSIKTEQFDNYIAENEYIYSILLMHEPDYVDSLNLNNYDLVLSGHSHNGQVKLPIVGAIVKPNGAKKYYDEYYKISNTDLYITSGIGTSNLKLRLFNKPSFNLYRLTNK